MNNQLNWCCTLTIPPSTFFSMFSPVFVILSVFLLLSCPEGHKHQLGQSHQRQPSSPCPTVPFKILGFSNCIMYAKCCIVIRLSKTMNLNHGGLLTRSVIDASLGAPFDYHPFTTVIYLTNKKFMQCQYIQMMHEKVKKKKGGNTKN